MFPWQLPVRIIHRVRFDVLTAVSRKSTVCSSVTPCN